MKDLQWLSLLPLELDGITPEPPKTEMRPEDHRLDNGSDELPLEIARLYTLYIATRKEADRLALEFKYASPGDEAARITLKLNRYAEISQCLSLILWISIKDYFGLWDKNYVSVRKGGQYGVVVWSDPPTPGPGDFFRQFFGGGM